MLPYPKRIHPRQLSLHLHPQSASSYVLFLLLNSTSGLTFVTPHLTFLGDNRALQKLKLLHVIANPIMQCDLVFRKQDQQNAAGRMIDSPCQKLFTTPSTIHLSLKVSFAFKSGLEDCFSFLLLELIMKDQTLNNNRKTPF